MLSIARWDTWEVLELKRNYDYHFNFFTILIASVKISVKLRACGDKLVENVPGSSYRYSSSIYGANLNRIEEKNRKNEVFSIMSPFSHDGYGHETRKMHLPILYSTRYRMRKWFSKGFVMKAIFGFPNLLRKKIILQILVTEKRDFGAHYGDTGI